MHRVGLDLSASAATALISAAVSALIAAMNSAGDLRSP